MPEVHGMGSSGGGEEEEKRGGGGGRRRTGGLEREEGLMRSNEMR